MTMTPQELLSWVVERNPDDSLRQAVVKLEFERRVADSEIETAKVTRRSALWMLCSVIVLMLTGIATAVIQYLAWMYPHIPK